MDRRVIAAIALGVLGGCPGTKTAPRSTTSATPQPIPEEPEPPPEQPPAAVRPELPEHGVAGLVVDDAGVPVGGAEVCAWAKQPPVEAVREDLLTPVCARVDRHGGYSLDLGVGVWRLVASAAQREPSQIEVVLRDASPTQVVDHELADGGRLFAGRVVDNFGRPIAGARVTASMGIPPRERGFIQVNAAADGRFEMWARHFTWLWVDAPGYTRDRHIEDGEDYVLIPESGVRGQVIDAEGKPVAGARVALLDRFGFYGQREDATRSDAQGRFELTRALPGARDLVALTDHGYGATTVDLDYADFVEGVVVRLKRWPALHLRVVEPGVGPVAMCAIDLASADRRRKRFEKRLWTNHEGEIDAVLPRGRYRVAETNCQAKVGTLPIGAIDLRRGDASMELKVTAGRTLRGRARTPEGEPIAHEEIWLRLPGREGRPAVFDHIDPGLVRTDARGRFEFTGLAPGTYSLYGTEWMDWDHDDMPTVTVEDDPVTEVELQLPPSGRVEVQSSRAQWDQVARLVHCAPNSRWNDNVRSDGRGLARFAHVPPGEVIVSIRRSVSCSNEDVPRLQVESGGEYRVEIEFEEPQVQTIVVHVEEPDGSPAHGALVYVDTRDDGASILEEWDEVRRDRLAMTDASGIARVELEADLRPRRIEAIAPGLSVVYGKAQAAPDFDHGEYDEDYDDEDYDDEEDDEDDGYIAWPGLEGLEFTVRLGPNKP